MIGPQIPSSVSLPTAAGPQLPPSLASSSSSSTQPPPAADSDSDDDDFGPSLPPDMLASRSTGAKPVIGPSFPSSFPPTTTTKPKRETPLSAAYSDDDDDDDFGPMPLPAGHERHENEGVRAFREREERAEEKRREEERDKGKIKREEWMLVPPKEMSLLSTMDPTKLKSRTFQQAAKPTTSSKGSSSGVNLWTETPQERQQRMEDEMMGKKRKAEIGGSGDGGDDEEDTDERRRKRERDWKLREEVERHNKATRSSSLLDTHSKSKKSKKDDKDEKGPPGIWDRDRDMSVGGRLMDDSKRKDIIQSAKDLGGKFSSGSYL